MLNFEEINEQIYHWNFKRIKITHSQYRDH